MFLYLIDPPLNESYKANFVLLLLLRKVIYNFMGVVFTCFLCIFIKGCLCFFIDAVLFFSAVY